MREPVIGGSLLTLAALVVLSFEALTQITVSGWVSMALGGVALVVAASLIERYGRAMAGRARDGWQEVVQWR